MVEKKLQELYNVHNVSSEKSWRNILKAANAITSTGEELKIDFSDVNIQNPWEHRSFLELINNRKVYMHFYNNPSIISHLRTLAIINGVSTDEIERRLSNEEVEAPRRKTADEITNEKKGMDLIQTNIKLWKGALPGTMNGKIRLADRYANFTNAAAVEYIRWAVEYLIAEKKLASFEIDFRGIDNFSLGALKSFAIVIYRLDKVIDVICTVDETAPYADKLNEYMVYESTMNMTEEERANIIKDDLVKNGGFALDKSIISSDKEKAIYLNIPGILARYRTSKGKDDLGRCGNGEVVSSRVALLRYIYKKENKLYANIVAYKDKSFVTAYEFMLDKPQDSMGFEIDHMETESANVELCDLGYKDAYLGAKYHFLEPCQRADEPCRKIVVGLTERGTNIKETVTTPLRMKRVFDSHGISYNEKLLELAIEKTDRLIKY